MGIKVNSHPVVARVRLHERWRTFAIVWRGRLAETLRDSPLPTVAVLWAITRPLYVVITYFGVLLTPPGGASVAPISGPLALAARWWFWDAGRYVNIAAFGYQQPSDAAYFPLYPALIHLLMPVWQGDGLHAGLFISQVTLLATMLGVAQWAWYEQRDRTHAVLAAALVAFSPLAFFLVSAYSDSIFLALTTWCLYCARRAWWLRGVAPLLFLASLARPTAIILLPAVLLEEWLWTSRHRNGAGRCMAAGWATPAVLITAYGGGFLIVCLLARATFGDATLPFTAATRFADRSLVGPWTTLADAWRQWRALQPGTTDQARFLVDAVPVLGTAVVLVGGLVRHAWQAATGSLMGAVLIAGLLILVLATPALHGEQPDLLASAGRYLLAGAAPTALLLVFALHRSPAGRALLVALLVGGGALQTLLLVFELQHGWLV